MSEVIDALNDLLAPHIFPAKADGGDARACPSCGTGQLSLKLSKYGTFVGCTNYPDCKYTRQMSVPLDGVTDVVPAEGIVLGTDPETGAAVTRRIGRFGPYIQLGEATEDGEKPRRASIPKGKDPASVTFEEAMRYLSLPREVGLHPETRTPSLPMSAASAPTSCMTESMRISRIRMTSTRSVSTGPSTCCTRSARAGLRRGAVRARSRTSVRIPMAAAISRSWAAVTAPM